MSYFEHTKRDLADAKREIGEAILALADDTNRKLNEDELDRTYIIEDFLARCVAIAHESGADAKLFEVGRVFFRHVPAYPIGKAGDETQEIPRGIVSKETIREAHNLLTFNGWPRHLYESDNGRTCTSIEHNVRDAGSGRVCGLSRENAIHDYWQKGEER